VNLYLGEYRPMPTEQTSPFIRLLEAPARVLVGSALALTVLIAVLDSLHGSTGSLGILYIIPMLIAAPALRRWQIVVLSLVFTVLREHFAPFGWDEASVARMSYGVISFLGGGLYSSELALGRRRASDYSVRLEEQVVLRREAENQMRSLIESSPAAIITLDTEGRVDLANLAAHEMLALPGGSLINTDVRKYLPVMADLLKAASDDLPYRTATTARGHRANGESFLACIWFATYPTRAGKRLAAIVTDSSDDLRDWQETSLQSLLRSTRVLVGSVSHEIRNVCAAISVVHANLGRIPGVAETEDYSALGTLAQGLARLATVELKATAEHDMGVVNLERLMDEFRIVAGPSLEAAEVELRIETASNMPRVLGDHHGLLQVMLNLSRNSLRALETVPLRALRLSVDSEPGAVIVRFYDSGPGVVHPQRLFQPFQQGADAVGLGLFVSRAIVRACDGELYHEPTASGCMMCLRLKPDPAPEPAGEWQTTEQLS
jgi:two-component system, LuxR family, sensor kinase FixL